MQLSPQVAARITRIEWHILTNWIAYFIGNTEVVPLEGNRLSENEIMSPNIAFIQATTGMRFVKQPATAKRLVTVWSRTNQSLLVS